MQPSDDWVALLACPAVSDPEPFDRRGTLRDEPAAAPGESHLDRQALILGAIDDQPVLGGTDPLPGEEIVDIDRADAAQVPRFDLVADKPDRNLESQEDLALVQESQQRKDQGVGDHGDH